MALDRLKTDAWLRFAEARGPLSGTLSDQLLRIGLAEEVNGVIQPGVPPYCCLRMNLEAYWHRWIVVLMCT